MINTIYFPKSLWNTDHTHHILSLYTVSKKSQMLWKYSFIYFPSSIFEEQMGSCHSWKIRWENACEENSAQALVPGQCSFSYCYYWYHDDYWLFAGTMGITVSPWCVLFCSQYMKASIIGHSVFFSIAVQVVIIPLYLNWLWQQFLGKLSQQDRLPTWN